MLLFAKVPHPCPCLAHLPQKDPHQNRQCSENATQSPRDVCHLCAFGSRTQIPIVSPSLHLSLYLFLSAATIL